VAVALDRQPAPGGGGLRGLCSGHEPGYVANPSACARNRVEVPVRSICLLLCCALCAGLALAADLRAAGESASAAAAAPAGGSAAAPADTLGRGWGPLPAPADSLTMRPAPPPPLPAWAVAVRVPYRILGIPFWLLDQTAKGSVKGLESLGAFEFTEQVLQGFRDPLGNYWLPDGSVGDRQGLEAGFLVQRPDFPLPGMRAKARFTYSTKRARLWSLGALAPLGPRSWFELGGGSQIQPQVDYWGRGLEAVPLEDDPAIYHRKTDWFGAGWRWHLGGGFELALHGHYSAVDAEDSDFEQDEALEVIYADRLPYGYGLTSAGLTGLVRLLHDDTDQTGRPAAGHRLLLLGQYYEPTDGTDTPFWTLGATAEQFVGLGLPQRTLAMKAWWLHQHEQGGDPVPFTRLLINATPHQLRGYPTERFHATGSLGASLEYRWPVWIHNEPEKAGVDAYLFVDGGQPFDRTAEIAARNLFFSFGGGLRAIDLGAGFALRLEVGAGREGPQLRISGSQLFQDFKAGFHDGRKPLPLVR